MQITLYNYKLIKTNIKGEDRKCITGGQYNNAENIIGNLERVYLLNKSYATRVWELGEKILDAHKTNNNGRINGDFKAPLNNDIRDSILSGLKTEIEPRLQAINNF